MLIVGLASAAWVLLGMPVVGQADTVWVEAEAFDQLGGWVVDQQSMDQMGSPYLLAHGLGSPVKDAETTVTFPAASTYRIWVRTRDWVAPWDAAGAPGRFRLLVDGKPLPTTFGTEGAKWHWQLGGTVRLEEATVRLALRDLTGFNGRCDAIVFSSDPRFTPPEEEAELAELRRELLELDEGPDDAGQYDLVVVGGGIAGICTAVSAARLGVDVALIQNRPVLGGNNSSEVRVGLSGQVHQQPYPRLGDLVDEISPPGHHTFRDAKKNPDTPWSRKILEAIEKHPEKLQHNAGPASNYQDELKLRVVESEPRLKLFLNTHVCRAEMRGGRIVAVIGKDICTNREKRFAGRLFADCTGDGNLGHLAGADYRVGRESRAQTGESLAPEKPDKLVMGTSVQWFAVEEEEPVPFPECPWAVQFNEQTCHRAMRGDWDWETGMNRDQIDDIEQIRDYALRVTFGNWSFLKNRSRYAEGFAKARLHWVAYIGGKRESRRLLGDVILRQQDLEQRTDYPDASVTTTWSIDLHYPAPENTKHFPGAEFRSVARHKRIEPYPIPYRCLYSRNVPNLMMAGRNISVTHVALGTIRVQRTTGMMGEVLGMAASLCKRHDVDPRGVYEHHLDELKQLMQRGAGRKATAAQHETANTIDRPKE